MRYALEKLQRLKDWWQTPAGQVLLQLEKDFLADQLSNLFGFQLVLVADDSFADLSNISRMSHCVRIDPFQQDITSLFADVDAVVIPHYLGFLLEAADWLQAINVKLAANGKIILTGYQHCSWLGVQKLLCRSPVRDLPKQDNQLNRMKTLLRQQNFCIETAIKFAPLWLRDSVQVSKMPLCQSLWGDIYCLAASKKIATIKTIKPDWDSSAVNVRQQQSLANPYMGERTKHER